MASLEGIIRWARCLTGDELKDDDSRVAELRQFLDSVSDIKVDAEKNSYLQSYLRSPTEGNMLPGYRNNSYDQSHKTYLEFKLVLLRMLNQERRYLSAVNLLFKPRLKHQIQLLRDSSKGFDNIVMFVKQCADCKYSRSFSHSIEDCADAESIASGKLMTCKKYEKYEPPVYSSSSDSSSSSSSDDQYENYTPGHISGLGSRF